MAGSKRMAVSFLYRMVALPYTMVTETSAKANGRPWRARRHDRQRVALMATPVRTPPAPQYYRGIYVAGAQQQGHFGGAPQQGSPPGGSLPARNLESASSSGESRATTSRDSRATSRENMPDMRFASAAIGSETAARNYADRLAAVRANSGLESPIVRANSGLESPTVRANSGLDSPIPVHRVRRSVNLDRDLNLDNNQDLHDHFEIYGANNLPAVRRIHSEPIRIADKRKIFPIVAHKEYVKIVEEKISSEDNYSSSYTDKNNTGSKCPAVPTVLGTVLGMPVAGNSNGKEENQGVHFSKNKDSDHNDNAARPLSSISSMFLPSQASSRVSLPSSSSRVSHLSQCGSLPEARQNHVHHSMSTQNENGKAAMSSKAIGKAKLILDGGPKLIPDSGASTSGKMIPDGGASSSGTPLPDIYPTTSGTPLQEGRFVRLEDISDSKTEKNTSTNREDSDNTNSRKSDLKSPEQFLGSCIGDESTHHITNKTNQNLLNNHDDRPTSVAMMKCVTKCIPQKNLKTKTNVVVGKKVRHIGELSEAQTWWSDLWREVRTSIVHMSGLSGVYHMGGVPVHVNVQVPHSVHLNAVPVQVQDASTNTTGATNHIHHTNTDTSAVWQTQATRQSQEDTMFEAEATRRAQERDNDNRRSNLAAVWRHVPEPDRSAIRNWFNHDRSRVADWINRYPFNGDTRFADTISEFGIPTLLQTEDSELDPTDDTYGTDTRRDTHITFTGPNSFTLHGSRVSLRPPNGSRVSLHPPHYRNVGANHSSNNGMRLTTVSQNRITTTRHSSAFRLHRAISELFAFCIWSVVAMLFFGLVLTVIGTAGTGGKIAIPSQRGHSQRGLNWRLSLPGTGSGRH